MRRTWAVWLSLAFLAGAAPAVAQEPDRPPVAPGVEIRGRVVDAEAGDPVPGASVAIWSPADGSIVTGAVAWADGSFQVPGVPPGSYYVLVTSIGHASYRSPEFMVGRDAGRTDLGVIRLARSLVEADEIQVEIERPAVTLAPDRNTYVARDIAPAATTASVSFACVLDQIDALQTSLRALGATTDVRDTPWNTRDIEVLTPEGARIVFTAAKVFDPQSAEGKNLQAVGIGLGEDEQHG